MNNMPPHEFVTHWVANSMCHQDSGLMDRYVWMSDSLTIDPIFCMDYDETGGRYSILDEGKLIFGSKYKLNIPSEEEPASEIFMER